MASEQIMKWSLGKEVAIKQVYYSNMLTINVCNIISIMVCCIFLIQGDVTFLVIRPVVLGLLQ